MVDFQSRDTRRGPTTDEDADDDSESGSDPSADAASSDDATGTADAARETVDGEAAETETDAMTADNPLAEEFEGADSESSTEEPDATDADPLTEDFEEADDDPPTGESDATDADPLTEDFEGADADPPTGESDATDADPLTEDFEGADADPLGVASPTTETTDEQASTEEPTTSDTEASVPARTEASPPADTDASEETTDSAQSETPPTAKTTTPTRSIDVAVVTVSGDRAALEYTAMTAFEAAGHAVVRCERPDSGYESVQQQVDSLVSDSAVDVVVTVGGAGLAADDLTIEAVHPLLEKALPGFGEAFRARLADQIGTGIVGVRSTAGLSDGTLVFCLPGDADAAELAIREILATEAPRLVSELEA
jgi:molybdenum cofactor biosynthesis protein B